MTGRTDPLGILELVEVCARERARSMSLFEHLGGWVRTTENHRLQRLFAIAAHRHAWHAELWAGRAPTIPVAAVVPAVASIAEAGDDADRWTAYATALGLLMTDLEQLGERVDRDLDPGTARVLELLDNDTRELAIAVAGAAP